MTSTTDSIIDCIKQENESSQDSASDSMVQRFSFIKNQDVLILLNHRSIYIDAMRTFVANVKRYCNSIGPEEELDLLLLAAECIDLTTLAGDDVPSNVERLCHRAINALDAEILPEYSDVSCRAVCVYPSRVVDCVNTFARLKNTTVNIASVAAGFPSGQYGLKSRIAEIVNAVENGADEIDVVINRTAAIQGNWVCVFQELCEMRRACDIRVKDGHKVLLKVIIGAGDLLNSTPNTIYFASLVSIIAGADFIKTSTGKESVNATLSISYIMLRAVIDYHNTTSIKVGFKPAGGIRTHKDALHFIILIKMMLGDDWLNSDLFRLGASGLLDSIEKRIVELNELIEKRE